MGLVEQVRVQKAGNIIIDYWKMLEYKKLGCSAIMTGFLEWLSRKNRKEIWEGPDVHNWKSHEQEKYFI